MNFMPEELYGEVEKFLTTEQGHADVFNRRIQQLVNNEAYLKKSLAETDAIAKGRNQAIVFSTYNAMTSWLTIPANIAALPNGTNLYIVDTEVPDYWWDAVAKLPRKLETQKVDLTTIEAAIAAHDALFVNLSNRTIDGVTFNGSAAITHYGVCSTVAATAAKIVALTNFTLVVGAEITVKFSAGNTATSPTLNVSSTGAKPIYNKGANVGTYPIGVYRLVYDGTSFNIVGDLIKGVEAEIENITNSLTRVSLLASEVTIEGGATTTLTLSENLNNFDHLVIRVKSSTQAREYISYIDCVALNDVNYIVDAKILVGQVFPYLKKLTDITVSYQVSTSESVIVKSIFGYKK